MTSLNFSASLEEMREDFCDAYIYIQDKLQSALEKEGLDFAIRKDRCLVTGASAGGTSSIFMVCRGYMSSADVPGCRHRQTPTRPPGPSTTTSCLARVPPCGLGNGGRQFQTPISSTGRMGGSQRVGRYQNHLRSASMLQ